MPHQVDEGLATTLKRVAAALKQAEVPFALGGSFAVYAHGGHSSDHDVDFLIREQDRDRVLADLGAAGFEVEEPPEDWLVKVFDEGAWWTSSTGRWSRRSPTRRWPSPSCCRSRRSACRWSSATQLMVHKLLSYTQHHCDFATGLPVARSLREQIDWDRVRRETAESPYAVAFLVLLDRLGVVPMPDAEMPDAERPDAERSEGDQR